VARSVGVLLPLLGLLVVGGRGDAAELATGHWVASWSASPTDAVTPIDAAARPVPVVLVNQTLRMVVVPHLGGDTMRIHLSNRFGNAVATFADVTAGLYSAKSVAGIQQVTFGGSKRVVVAKGADVVSDPVHLEVSAFTAVAISIYLPGLQKLPTKHWNANATSYYALPLTGDRSHSAANSVFRGRTQAWLYIDGLDVVTAQDTHAIVAFGDSITDGFVASNPLSLPVSTAVADLNKRYPDDLQHRIDAAGLPVSVVNAGIASNRLLTDGEPLFEGPSGLERLQQDALDEAGVTGVILLEGINDFGIPPARTTAAQLIDGFETAIAMAHAAGKRIWLGTITPASNALMDGVRTAPDSETNRQAANAWIRSQQLADGVIDFDAAIRDPNNPSVIRPDLSGPDHLHPNLLGYQAMANEVDLSMLAG
jgi:lysophospholipase L1-like esterase